MNRLAVALVLAASVLVPPQQPVIRNPHHLRAVELLAQRRPGVPPRVRFEWDQVTGAREYALTGRWTKPPSWTMQTNDYRVTAQTATSWDAERVQFDVTLPEGHHSWKVVALFGAGGVGDFANPTPFSFELR